MAPISSIGLVELQATLQRTQTSTLLASTAITNFLNNPNSSQDWDNMNTIIQVFMTENSRLLAGLRVLVTLSDGRVAYDTNASNNTYLAYQNNAIGENHNSRVSIMTALLGSSGTGNELKYSTSTGTLQGYNAVRMGLSTSDALGCTRVSVNSS